MQRHFICPSISPPPPPLEPSNPLPIKSRHPRTALRHWQPPSTAAASTTHRAACPLATRQPHHSFAFALLRRQSSSSNRQEPRFHSPSFPFFPPLPPPPTCQPEFPAMAVAAEKSISSRKWRCTTNSKVARARRRHNSRRREKERWEMTLRIFWEICDGKESKGKERERKKQRKSKR